MGDILLEARNIKKYFPVGRSFISSRRAGWLKAVDGVSFCIRKGEILALVGESGCGKTTTFKLLLLLERLTSGSILFRGQPIERAPRDHLRNYRRSIGAVFQDPSASLDPRMRVAAIVGEPLMATQALSGSAVKQRVGELLNEVGLSASASELYPHEFSGGQRQRIAIARAMALNPELVLLDEPVSALDVSIRAQIMNLLMDLQEKLGGSYLMIAHDLAVVKHMSTRVAVMYLGKIVECAPTLELYSNPLHPYTKALLSAALPSHPSARGEDAVVQEEVPSPLHPPPGCRFEPRCSCASSACREVEPRLLEVTHEHEVACHLHAG